MKIQSISQLETFSFNDFHNLSTDTNAYIELVYPKQSNATQFESYKFQLNQFFRYVMTQLNTTLENMRNVVNTRCTETEAYCNTKFTTLSSKVNERLGNYVCLNADDINTNADQTINGNKTFNATITATSINASGAVTVDGALTTGSITNNGATTLQSNVNITGATTIESTLQVNNNITCDNLHVIHNIDVIQIDSTNINNTEKVTTDEILTNKLTATYTPAELTAKYAWWG